MRTIQIMVSGFKEIRVNVSVRHQVLRGDGIIVLFTSDKPNRITIRGETVDAPVETPTCTVTLRDSSTEIDSISFMVAGNETRFSAEGWVLPDRLEILFTRREAVYARRSRERPFVRITGDGNQVNVAGRDLPVRGRDDEPSGTRVDSETTVWYATNRRPRVPEDPSQGFGSVRDDRTHYGCCKVFVPESHKIGELGSPWWRRLVKGDDRLKLTRITDQKEETTWDQIRSTLSGLPATDRHAVAFIHGYNVTFEDAALRAAQIGFDLQIPAMAFFSWPSRGRLRFYVPDEATIGASELAITEFLTRFARLHDQGTAVHVIAHSMGNRALLRGMERVVARAEERSGKCFNQIILAAPDIDRDEFRQLAGIYEKACERTTLYVSARDRALASSRWIHAENRVGYSPPVTIVPGIDTINVTNIDLSFLGHGYVAEAREVLYDMHDLIFNGTEPDRRMALRPRTSPDGKFWEIRA